MSYESMTPAEFRQRAMELGLSAAALCRQIDDSASWTTSARLMPSA